MASPVYFLSYSRKNISDVRFIAQTLMMHGIRIWQDISSLGTGVAESKIRRAIQKGSVGLIFFVTQESIDSTFIRDVELPEAERRYKNDHDYKIVPIFKLPIDTATAALKGCLNIPLSNFNGAVIKGIPSKRNVLSAAHKAAEIVLDDVRLDKGDPFYIGLSSKQEIRENVALSMDFQSFFKKGVPPPNVWEKHFSVALGRVKNALIRRNQLSIRLHAFCHLSLGMLFGYIFRKPTGFRLEIEQITAKKSNIWATDSTPGKNPLKIIEMPAVLGSKNLLVKINLLSADDKSIIRYADKNALSYRAMLEFCPPIFPHIVSQTQALAIARDLIEKIKEMHARYETDTVHLFCAIPLGLALLIGYNMNACGTIKCYEFDNARREYLPSCFLT